MEGLQYANSKRIGNAISFLRQSTDQRLRKWSLRNFLYYALPSAYGSNLTEKQIKFINNYVKVYNKADNIHIKSYFNQIDNSQIIIFYGLMTIFCYFLSNDLTNNYIMKIAQFLNSISTPYVKTGSIRIPQTSNSNARNTHKKQAKLNFKPLQSGTTIKNKHCFPNKSLHTLAPFYIDKRAKTNYFFPCSNGHHSKHVPSNEPKENYLRKKEGNKTTWDMRVRIGKQKRGHERNYQRFTYQPNRTIIITPDRNHQIRKQYAQLVKNHRFCQFFRISCSNCKCKLDCINQKFEEFLRRGNLVLLSGLSKIAGRGLFLDSDIKGQIIEIFMQNQGLQSLEAIMKMIKDTVINKLQKEQGKKYLKWAKEIIEILCRLGGKTQTIEKGRRGGRRLLRKGHEKMEQQQSNIAKFDFYSSLKKKKDRRKGRKLTDISQRSLSIIGSRAQIHDASERRSYRTLSIANTKSEDNHSEKQSSMQLIEAKFKSRINSYRTNQTSVKRNRKNTNSSFNSQFKNQLSQFYEKKVSQQPNIDQDIKIQYVQQVNNLCQEQSVSQKIHVERKSKQVEIVKIEEKKNFIKRQHHERKKPAELVVTKEQQPQRINLRLRNKIRNSKLRQRKSTSIKSIKKQVLLPSKKRQDVNKSQLEDERNALSLQKFAKPHNKASFFRNFAQSKPLKSSDENGQRYAQGEEKGERIKKRFIDILEETRQNKNIIKQVQNELKSQGLQSCILHISDSLLTKKRKIRNIQNLIKKGKIKNLMREVGRYLTFFGLKFGPDQRTEQSEAKGEFHMFSKLDFEKNLKFYDLQKAAIERKDGDSEEEQSQKKIDEKETQVKNQERIHEKIKAIRQQKQPVANRHYLGSLENFSTQKAIIPFDYFHYLRMGNNILRHKQQKKEVNVVRKNMDPLSLLALAQKQVSRQKENHSFY